MLRPALLNHVLQLSNRGKGKNAEDAESLKGKGSRFTLT
jgi:hypothetical protein